ncbi:amino acid adenylation domain-containing protein [Bacillus cereus group sp. Bce002]|uniref:amino acid adenylation domain-containing protein n=1 Tax=Bacillus cereus group sp. Bce002 TaxID=3445259 RepID=UPI003F25A0AA
MVNNIFIDEIIEIFKSNTEIKEFDGETDLFELNLSSLKIIKILGELESKCDIKIEFSDFIESENINALIDKVTILTNEKSVQTIRGERDNYEPFELTDIQLAYLTGQNKEFDLGGITTHAYFEFKTQLDMQKLSHAIQQEVTRQEMLRCIFLPNGTQKILKDVPKYEIAVEDVSHLSVEQQQTRITELRKKLSYRNFNPEVWPLFEFSALKLDYNNYYLFFDIDALIADGLSIQIFLDDLINIYKDNNVSELNGSFRDIFDKRKFNDKRYIEDREYWINKVDNIYEAPDLPYKTEISKVEIPNFKRQEKLLTKEQWKLIEEKCGRYKVRPSIFLLGCYAKILSKWGNQQGVSVNVTTFSRNEDSYLDRVIGDFTSLLLVSYSDACFSEFWSNLKGFQADFFRDYEHKSYTGLEVINNLLNKSDNENTSISAPVVFTSMLFDETENVFNEIGHLEYSVTQTPQVILDHQVLKVGEGVILSWDYVSELFEKEILENMFIDYISLIEKLIFDSGEKYNSIEEVTKYNKTEKKFNEKSLVSLFDKHFQKHPNNIAIEAENRSLTYSELDKFSNKVSSYLKENGIKSGDFVAVMGERTSETIIGILGILKIGAAYIPLASDIPLKRKETIFKDSNCKMELNTTLINEILSKEYTHYVEDQSQPDSIAYAIYTSGSTGTPKGVVIKHQAAVNTILDINSKFDVTERDKVIGLSNLSFDLSVYDIFGTLAAGATLVLIEDQRDVKAVRETVLQKGITIWNSVPMVMEMLVDYCESLNNNNEIIDYSDLPDLRLVLLSGDWIPLSLPERIKEQFLGSEVISLGGATEASIWSIYYPIDEVSEEWKSIPYGYPLSNQTYYVLNYANEICPIGVKGELYIGGMGLAEGYLNDQEKTNKAFINHPQLGRIYKTGDMGKMTPEGYIEFLGREDSQVKIRGYRVEIGEIEKTILQYKGMKNAVVLNKRNKEGMEVLYSYFVNEEKVRIENILNYMKLVLPSYMIPSYMTQVENIPLTNNGKVDKKELLKMDLLKVHTIQSLPESVTEEKILDIWKEHLEMSSIGIDDNFFDVGGNSIVIIKIITAVESYFSIKLAFKDFINNPTVRKLAFYVDESERINNYRENIFKVDTKSLYQPFKLTNIQMAYLAGRSKQFELGGTSTHAYLELKTDIDIDKFNESLQYVIERHPMLRAVILPDGRQQILDRVPKYFVDVVDMSCMDSQEKIESIEKMRGMVSQRVFNPEIWPLFEFKAIKISDTEYRLLFGIDMLIADGASILILFKEISDYYTTGKEKPLIEMSYRDYIENVSVRNKQYEIDREFWTNKLKDFPSSPKLPLKGKIGEVKNPVFKRMDHLLSFDKWKNLSDLAAANQVTPAIVLFTAYAKTLSKWSNQAKLAINTTVFNRQSVHKDVDKIIGDFTSLLMVDVDFSKENDFWTQAKQIQENFMSALEHRQYDGVEFLRDYIKYNDLDPKAANMPIVFTSMLFGNNTNIDGFDNFGSLENAVSQTSQVILDHQILELDNGILLSWDYVAQLFEQDQLQEMFDYYLSIIYTNGNSINETYKKLENEYFEYNSGFIEFKKGSLHSLFMDQVNKNPNNIAIEEGERTILYSELDKQSDCIGAYLIQNGVQRGDYVAVLGERKIETVSAILGILKIGAAYIPLSPDIPKERKDKIIADSKCEKIIDIDLISKILKEESTRDIEIINHPGDVAYTIYTSGSTGMPKGVVIKHQAVVNTILDVNSKFNVTEEDKVIGLSNLSFDLSVYDIFGTFAAGATLVLIEDQRDVKTVREIVLQKGITIWNSVPKVMEMLIDYSESIHSEVIDYSNLPNLRLVLLSGDWIPLSLPERIKEQFVGSEVISLGGATEASIWSIYYPIEQILEEWNSIPYGYPLSNQKYYVLNFAQELCPLGVKGDLYIGGSGLAEGYLNDSKKTEMIFIEHPKYGRLYKTGDIGKMASKGYIEFLGRDDSQIKIRGYRVELSEIENTIMKYPGIKAVKVLNIVKENKSSSLQAYIVGDKKWTSNNMTQFLGNKLPSYMIPSSFIQVNSIPLTNNGKVNVKLLKELKATTPVLEKKKPKTSTEEKLIEKWKEIFKSENIGIEDNFFDLGGDSVTLINLFSTLQKESPALTVTDLFKYQTIEELGEFLDGFKNSDLKEQKVIRIKPNYSKQSLSELNGEHKNSRLTFSISKNFEDNLEIIRGQIETAFGYVLGGVINSDHVLFASENSTSNLIFYRGYNLTEYTDWKDILSLIKRNTIKKTYEISYYRELEVIVEKLGMDNPLTACIHHGKNNNVYNNLEIYDIYFEYELVEEKMMMKLECSNGTIGDNLVEKMFNLLINIIKAL